MQYVNGGMSSWCADLTVVMVVVIPIIVMILICRER